MSTEDERWMRRALELAERASFIDEVPVGAVVVLDGKMIGEGWNQPISRCDPSAHAEIMALRQAGEAEGNYRLPNAVLYVTIEPCTMCAGALIHARIGEVVFAAAEPKAGAVISNARVFDQPNINHRVQYRHGIFEAEAISLMQSFFKRRRTELKALKKRQKEFGEK